MSSMIKLRLQSGHNSLEKVEQLPGLRGLTLDRSFGLLCISPAESLYVVRAPQADDIESRKAASPEILEFYGDIRISPFSEVKSSRGSDG